MYKLFVTITLLAILCNATLGQTTAFKYQGSLTDSGNPASGTFQMQFKLFDAVSGGTQVGATVTNTSVAVASGVFSLNLDFGANALSGANRWIEIAVRRNSNESYVTLSPREQIASSPYAVRTLSALQADTALDSQKLGGVNANQFVQTIDPRLADPRTPLPGSTNYIQNQNAAPQAASNFNISGNGSLGNLNLGGSLTAAGTAAPATAPVGQGRFFYDSVTNKFRISENGQAFVNLVGASGVSGSGNVNRIPFFSAATTLSDSNIFQLGSNIGIGTAAPGSGFELRGTGFGAQQRITDSVSGNSLVLQSGPGSSMKVGGFNYSTGTAQPLYLSTDGANTFINSGGGTLGIGTSNPSPFYRIDSVGSMRASANTHVNFTAETSGTNNGARFNMRSATRNWFIGTSQSLNGDQFYIGEGDSLTAGQRMVITTGGLFGFGTLNPHPNYRADFIGGVRSMDTASTQFLAETTGSTNAWARYYMRTSNQDGSPVQTWFIGTSRNFNGNQLYIGDETLNQTRFSITPNGPVYMQGMVTGSVGGYGLPKAMLFVLSNGTISQCYNGITGQASSGCGFSVVRNDYSFGPLYTINIGSPTTFRFVSLVGEGGANYSSRVISRSGNQLSVQFFATDPIATTPSDFHLIVY